MGVFPSLDASAEGFEVRDHLAQILVDEVVNTDGLGCTLRLPLTAAILEISDKFLLFRVDGDDGLTFRDELFRGPVDVLELRVPIGRLVTFARLANDLEAVSTVRYRIYRPR